MSFWGELGRRNVVKVGAAYLVVGWLFAQVIGLVLPAFEAPAWVMQTILVVLALGLPVVLVIAWAFEITPDGIKRTADVPETISVTAATGRSLNQIVIVLLVLAVVFLIVDNYVLDENPVPAAASTGAPATAPAAGAGDEGTASVVEASPLPNSVAVLPLTNISPDEDKAYFAAGMHEELLNQLAKLENLNVISRTSVMRYADNRPSIREIARELNVGAVVEASARYADDRVLVTVQLIDAATDVHLWSDSYQGDLSDVFAIQASIAMNVANALNAEFSAEEQESLERRPTASDEAYDHWLIAQSSLQQQREDQAADELELALAFDPGFVDAQVQLARILTGVANLAAGIGDDTWAERRDRAVARALEIAPDHPGILALEADRQLEAFEWQAAEATLLEMLALAGANDQAANESYGHFLISLGRVRDALSYLDKARRLDPLAAERSSELAVAYDAIGEHDRAAALFRQARSLRFRESSPVAIMPEIWSALAAGDFELGSELIQATWSPSPESQADVIPFVRMMNVAFGALEEPERALEGLRMVFDDAALDNAAATANIAFFAAYFGDADLAIAAWRRSMAQGTPLLRFLWTPLLQPVRRHPEFKDLMREFGFVDYWRSAGWPEHCQPLGDDDLVCS